MDSTMAGVPAFLAQNRIGMVCLVLGRDVQDRPASGQGRNPVREEPTLGHEDARRPRAARKLVRREEDGVLVRQVAVLDVRGRVHLDGQVRPRGRVVPEARGAVLVEQDRHRVDVGDDSGHVRRGGEAADLQRTRAWRSSSSRRWSRSKPPLDVFADDDDVRNRLAPEQLVRVVLEGADEDDWPGAWVELEDAHEPVDRAGRRPSPRRRRRRHRRRRPLGG